MGARPICTQHRKQSRVVCVCITGEEFAIHPKTKKHIYTAIPTQSTPTIFAPDAHTTANKVVLCKYASQTRNSLFTPKTKNHIYTAITQALHAAHTCPTCIHRYKQSAVVCVCHRGEEFDIH